MKRYLMFVLFWALCALDLFAQSGPRVVVTPETSAIHVPPQEAPAGLKKIYTNLGTSKTDLYSNSASGISGPNGAYGRAYSIALPFTPKFNSTVTEVQVAVGYAGSGTNQVNLSIFADAKGKPGKRLAGPVTVKNLPKLGTCCTLAVANFTPVAVTAGTQYWVAANEPLHGPGSDFDGGWSWVVKQIPTAINDGFGWFPQSADEVVAGEVLGTIP